MGVINRVMIGPAGIVDLHITPTTGYGERQQWGGREGASIALFVPWLIACHSESYPRIPEVSRLDGFCPPPSLPYI